VRGNRNVGSSFNWLARGVLSSLFGVGPFENLAVCFGYWDDAIKMDLT
jgi:hypothetical protein